MPTFTTTAAAGPLITAGPSVSGATVTWATDEPATSVVDYGTTVSYGSQAAGSVGVTHAVPLPGLSPETEYHYRVSSTDTCGPRSLAERETPRSRPALRRSDVSGWVLKQFHLDADVHDPAGDLDPRGRLSRRRARRDARGVSRRPTRGSRPGRSTSIPTPTAPARPRVASPQINGDETFELYDAGNVKLDGATVAMSTTHRAYQRNHPQDAAGSLGSWTIVDESLANPGAGAGSGNGAGVRINEMADAADFTKEYVELYYDAAPSAPDTIAPAAIASLDAVPLSSNLDPPLLDRSGGRREHRDRGHLRHPPVRAARSRAKRTSRRRYLWPVSPLPFGRSGADVRRERALHGHGVPLSR
jgi:hypothetical protein